MSITIKKESHIEKMRIAGRITGETLNLIEKSIRPGITTKELDRIAEEYIRSCGAVPSFKGLYGYPASICASVNEQVVHGIPSGNTVLKEGDIISIDTGAYIDGFHGDAARTFGVGQISEQRQRLIEDYVESNGYGVVRDYVGHGIGRDMHEDPEIPNYRTGRPGPKLVKGMTLAIEPMVTVGTYKVHTLPNRWTVVTNDGSDSAHYENTVLVTENEPELLTLV